jgi:hypothetical protein
VKKVGRRKGREKSDDGVLKETMNPNADCLLELSEAESL